MNAPSITTRSTFAADVRVTHLLPADPGFLNRFGAVGQLIAAPLAVAFLLAGCVEQRCFEQADCETPRICGAMGSCVLECEAASDCASGFTCEANRCMPDSEGPISCPSDMVAVADTFCVDRYEASRPDATRTSQGVDASAARSVAGVMPWQVASNAVAAEACAAAGKRLCRPEEWQLACSGPDRTVYGYGDGYEPTTCNGLEAFGRSSFPLMPTGAFPQCTNEWGAFDLNGNLWEHTEGGTDMTIRGGAFNCGDSPTYHRCDYVPGTWTPSARGFRCCLTPSSMSGADGGLGEGGSR